MARCPEIPGEKGTQLSASSAEKSERAGTRGGGGKPSRPTVVSNCGRTDPCRQAGPRALRSPSSCAFTRAERWAEAEAAPRCPSSSPTCQWFAPNTPPRAAGAAARPTSGCCRALYPVSARPQLRRRRRCRDAVPVALRVPGIQPLALRLSEGELPSRETFPAWGLLMSGTRLP